MVGVPREQLPCYAPHVTLSAVVITRNEEDNIGRTLAGVIDIADEIILVDSGSTDHTLDIARSFGTKVRIFTEEWKGFAGQKNSAIAKAKGEWILSLDADEEVDRDLATFLADAMESWKIYRERTAALAQNPHDCARELNLEQAKEDADWHFGDVENCVGLFLPRKNFFLGRWIRRGGFYPDAKLRLVRRELAKFEDRLVHEDIRVSGRTAKVRQGALLHHAYPTLSSYIDHMNRYSTLGAEMALAKNNTGFSLLNIVLRPAATFLYNYVLRLGFLDGREGLLLHLYHAAYVSWKYAKVWELSRKPAGKDSTVA